MRLRAAGTLEKKSTMKDIIAYLLQANVTLAAGYVLFRLCGTDTFLRLRRTLLLAIGVFALLCPLLSRLLPPEAAAESLSAIGAEVYALPAIGSAPVRKAVVSLPEAVAGTYLLVAAVLAVRLAMQTLCLLHRIRRLPVATVAGSRCRVLPERHEAFSFLGYLCLPADVLRSPHLPTLLRHERAHIRQRHTLDVLWSRLLRALCWPNPAAWLMERDLRLLHEYLADAATLDGHTPRTTYQRLILSFTFPLAAAQITNKFNVSSIKKRITMMNRKRTPGLWQAKYLLLAPMAALMVGMNRPAQAMNGTQTTETSVTVAGSPATAPGNRVAKADRSRFRQLAQYSDGGMAGLLKFISDNLKYPAAAKSARLEGISVVKFTVGTDGKVSNPKIVKSLSPECDAEVLRVVGLLKKFQPAIDENGRAISSDMTLPVRFKLQK